MAHSQHTTKFQTRLETFFDSISGSVNRRVVAQMPDVALGGQEINRKTLNLCTTGWEERDREAVLNFFNDDWTRVLDTGLSITHWCLPGCCNDQHECVSKCKQNLELLLGKAPDVPLLYRWKHFEPCLEYSFRGLAVHQIFAHALCFILGADANEEFSAALEFDDADEDPGLRQRVRLNKTYKFFASEGCLVKLAKAAAVTRPLATYMDKVSFVESVRQRIYLRNQGLVLPRSKCTATVDELIAMNHEIISGKLGWQAVRELFEMLRAPDGADCWLQWLGPVLQYQDCFQLILPAMCNAWRRCFLTKAHFGGSLTLLCLTLRKPWLTGLI
ncbi:unnamed protein product [Durusdinium trenchii]|uniref:Uncharacterized protein n=2 Tax=Durusdinium trenchii TaxID=1381693 RepID=A0ABP0SXV2_9DINO